jgi:hypothetical protein
MFVLIIGAGLTSLLLPWINSRIDHNKLVREAKHKEAVEIISRNTDFDSQLNSLKTRLTTFHFGNLRDNTPEAEYRKAQKELDTQMREQYLVLDRFAWWWWPKTLQEAWILELADTKAGPMLRKDFDEYGAQVKETVRVLKQLWDATVSPAYKPDSSDYEKLLNDTEDNINDLTEERKRIINRIVQHFSSR